MKKISYKIGSKAGKTILWVFSSILIITILTQISLWVGIKWLNSQAGYSWVQNQLNIALQDSDYKLHFDGFEYRPLTAIHISNLNISDSKGVLAKIEDTRLNIDILSLSMKQLSIGLTAKKIELSRLPQSKNENQAQLGIQPFHFPDLYFHKILISDVQINNLEISETIAGQKINLSPAISGTVSVSKDRLNINFQLKPDIKKISAIKELPEIVTVKANYNSTSSLFNLEQMAIKSGLYSLSSSGQASFKTDGKVSLTANLNSNNLSTLNPLLEGKLNSDLNLSGTLNSLNLSAEGILDLIQLQKNDLKPIKFHAYTNLIPKTDQNMPIVELQLSSAYKNFPITLGTQITANNEVIHFKNIKANAPDINLNGTINFNTNAALLDGNLSADITKLDSYKKLIGRDINGSGSIKIELSNLVQSQKLKTESQFKSLQFNGINIDSLNFKTTTEDIKQILSTQISTQLKNLKSNGITLKTLEATISENIKGEYAFTSNGNGQFKKPFSFKVSSTLKNLENQGLPPKAENIKAAVILGKDTINLSGEMDTQNIDLKLETKSLSFTNLLTDLPNNLASLSLAGKASASGSMNNPILEADIKLSPLRVTKNTPDISLSLAGNYNSEIATINLNGQGTGIKTLRGNIKTPIKLSFNPFILDISNNHPIEGNLNISAQIKDILDRLIPPQYDLSGLLTTQIIMSGNAKNPQFSGDAELKNGSFTDEALGIKLNDISMSALLNQNTITLKNFNARDETKGKLFANGEILLENNALEKVNLNLNILNFHLLQSNMADGIFNADFNLSGTPNQYNLSGTIKSDHIDINIPEKHNQSIPELNIVEEKEESLTDNLLEKIGLNVQFIANNRIFVRGWGLDAEFGGKVLVKGDLSNPQFNGQLQSNRGRYEEFGKRFKLTKANLNFLGSIPPSPNLDIVAETKADDITARINLNGSINNPKIDFSSTPSLPDDEILSRILFGRDLSTISPFQAVQLAQTIRRFSGKGGNGTFDPLNTIRKATGFDDLRVETDEEGQANVGVGKYLTDKVYLEFEKGTGEDSGAANLEVEVTPNITIESELGQDTQGGAGVFWEWDY